MGHFSVFVFFAFAVCLVACMCASAAGENGDVVEVLVYNVEQAKKAVEAAKTATNKTCVEAQSNIDNARSMLEKVEEFKKKAENAAADAQKEAIGYEQAKKIVDSIKSISDTVNKLYSTAQETLDTAVSNMDKLLKTAEGFKSESNIDIPATESEENNYTTVTNKALDLKQKALELDNSITDEVTKINEVQSSAETIEQHAKEAQLKNLEVSCIVAVAKIETMVGKANGIFTSTGKERDAVHESVQETKEHCTNDIIESYDIIKDKCKRAEDELTSATNAVEKAKNAITAINTQKTLAGTALENVQKEEKDVSKAEEEANAAKQCVTTAGQNVDVLTTALQAVKTSLTNANNAKQEIKTALSTTTSKPSPEEVKETQKSDIPLGDGTDSHQKHTTVQPTITKTEQPTSKDSLGQSDNRAEAIKQTLIKGAQNVPTTALTGGKAPAPGAKNDSAMTVSVPLLVALIASAVLQ